MRNSITNAYVPDEVNANNNTVDAAMTGSGNTSVLEFAGDATVSANYIAETTTADLGTLVQVTSAGMYLVSFSFVFTGAVNVAGGISFNSALTALTADPVVGVAGVIFAQDATSAVDLNTQIGGEVCVRVTQADIASANGASFRFLATNSGGAAPVGIVVSSVQYRIEKIASLSV